MPSRSRRDLIYDLLAPPLILTTPFASFVNYNDYGFARMEVWLVLGGLIALGLLCGSCHDAGRTMGAHHRDRRAPDLVRRLPVRLARQAAGASRSGFRYRHAAAELASARAIESDHDPRFRNDAGGDFGPSWSFGGTRPSAILVSAWTPGRRRYPAPPVVVHLIFDEFIGLAGIPSIPDGEAARDQLRSFFLDNGFLVFGHAYSRFVHTRNAILEYLELCICTQ